MNFSYNSSPAAPNEHTCGTLLAGEVLLRK